MIYQKLYESKREKGKNFSCLIFKHSKFYHVRTWELSLLNVKFMINFYNPSQCEMIIINDYIMVNIANTMVQHQHSSHFIQQEQEVQFNIFSPRALLLVRLIFRDSYVRRLAPQTFLQLTSLITRTVLFLFQLKSNILQELCTFNFHN